MTWAYLLIAVVVLIPIVLAAALPARPESRYPEAPRLVIHLSESSVSPEQVGEEIAWTMRCSGLIS